MSNIDKILIPFDFTEPAVAALTYALGFVGFERAVQVEAIYVSKVEVTAEAEEKAKADFDSIVKSLNKRTKLKPRLVTATGELVGVIMSTRKERNADLVIMGTLGDNSIDEHVTNTSKFVLEADCPVITVPFGSDVKTPKEIALVLGKEEIEDANILSLLLHIARTFNAKVHVLTIYKESIYGEKTLVETNEDSLKYYLEHFYTDHRFEKNQDVEKGIFDYINEKNIDLLAILPRNHAQKTKPSEGRLTKLLTLHSSIPVLTLD